MNLHQQKNRCINGKMRGMSGNLEDYQLVIGESIVEIPCLIREKHENVKENSRKKGKNAKKIKKR